MLRRNGASVYIERGMSFKSFFLNKKDLNSYMCYFIFIFARTVTAEDMIRISASLNFFRLSFCNCLSCVFNFEDLLFIIHYTHYLSSHWLRAYSLFLTSAQPTDQSVICQHNFQEQCQSVFPLLTVVRRCGYRYFLKSDV